MCIEKYSLGQISTRATRESILKEGENEAFSAADERAVLFFHPL